MYPKFIGFNENQATFLTSGTVNIGDPVTVCAEGTVKQAAGSTAFCGVVTDKRGNYVSVTLTGYARAAYTGSAPVYGYNSLASDGSGAVKTDSTNGRQLLVVGLDTTAKTAEILL